MNTPPKIKRHSGTLPIREAVPDGHYISGLSHPVIGAQFAEVVTAFEQLESEMPRVLAILLGGHDTETAGYVLRSIRNPATKKDVLWALLEKARVNMTLPGDYDEILREYQRIASQRNQLVHGKWYTLVDEPQRVYLSRSSEHGWYFFDIEEVVSDELTTLAADTHALTRRLLFLTTPELYRRKHGEELPLQRRAPNPESNTDPQSAPAEPEPPPQSSEA